MLGHGDGAVKNMSVESPRVSKGFVPSLTVGLLTYGGPVKTAQAKSK